MKGPVNSVFVDMRAAKRILLKVTDGSELSCVELIELLKANIAVGSREQILVAQKIGRILDSAKWLTDVWRTEVGIPANCLLRDIGNWETTLVLGGCADRDWLIDQVWRGPSSASKRARR